MSTALPETIGNFRILSKLGQGGMGAVFRAVHGTLERPVALKLLPPEFASNPEYVMRFLREARTVATLRHENVVQVYDAGESGGQYFIAMELVDGSNLLKYIEEKQKLPEGEAMGLLLQAGKGLAAAHTKGLVHRDIKPENLLLGTDNVLRIVDFGLVMESLSTTQLTATGACLGTPMYMSPEQADGEQADVRTDIYSLGVTFFRVFTGHPPFTSPTVMNLLFKHKFEAPPSPKSLRPDLSDDASNLILLMMSKRREDRPQNAQALVELIEGIKQGKHIPAPPVFVPPHATHAGSTHATMLNPSAAAAAVAAADAAGPRSNRRPALLAAVAVAALIGVAAFLAYPRDPQSRPDQDEAKSNHDRPPAPQGDDTWARADEAFAAGRHSDALELYREALIARPDNDELKSRIEKTVRAMKFGETMQAAELHEARGELEQALDKYNAAIELDTGTSARQRKERVAERIEQNRALNTTDKDRERESLAAKAAQAEKAQNYEQAADLYSRAAALADGAVRSALADKANESRRQGYLLKAIESERDGDLAGAAVLYERAQKIKNDPLAADKLAQLQKRVREQAALAETDRAYASAMRAGQTALAANNLKEARVQFGVAFGLKSTQEAGARLKEVDGQELLAKGDAAKNAGNNAVARTYYSDAMKVWPALAAQAQARIAEMDKSAPRASAVLDKVDAHVRAQRDDEALREVIAALRSDAQNNNLKEMKWALESMDSSNRIYKELQTIANSAIEHTRTAQSVDDSDEQADTYKEKFERARKRFDEKSRKLRDSFLAHNYAGVKGGLDDAREDASDLASNLSDASDTYDSKADKYAGVVNRDVPLIGKVRIGGDKKKAEKYRSLASSFKDLASQARDLRK